MSNVDRAAPLAALGQGAARDLARREALTGTVVGVGVDAVDVDRFRRVLERRVRLADRLFTRGEQDYARAATDPVPRMSTRFAAKEATMKALGVGLGAFPFVDVEVVRIDLEAPTLVLHGAAEALARSAGVRRLHLSLTHTDELAMAMVIAEGHRGVIAEGQWGVIAEGDRDGGAEGDRDGGAEGDRDGGAEGDRDGGAEGDRGLSVDPAPRT